MEQRGNDHALALELTLQFGAKFQGYVAQLEGGVAHIERVLEQSAVVVQMVVDAGGGGEEVVASLVEVFNEVIYALAPGGAEQVDEFLFFEFYSRVHNVFRMPASQAV